MNFLLATITVFHIGQGTSSKVPRSYSEADGPWPVQLVQELWNGDKATGLKLWGSFEHKPLAVYGLKLFQGKVEVVVPPSAYLGLSNVRNVQIRSRKGGAVVIISGGDASTSFSSVLEVRGQHVVRATVRDGEFPKNFYQITRFVARNPGD